MDIRILPSNIANMIAAGEVVQRPASVVKELMENAIDAGADQIQVIIKDAGRTLIQVIDNGCGMSPDQAVLCFERHATSKIANAGDLARISTFGFRGEALASIAAVAEVTLKTREAHAETACQVEFADSNMQSVIECAAPQGSSFSVRNLFYNIPARRKFLKSDNVEFRHICEEFTRIALTRPEISFFLTHNDKEIHQLRKASSLKYRIKDLLGSRAVDKIVDLKADTSIFSLSGFVCRPDLATKTAGEQFFFVNGRYFRSPYLHKAVLKAYQDMIPDGALPSYYIFFTIDPSSIDVNISPTKTEIKFEEESLVFQTVYASVREALGRNSFGSTIDFDTAAAPELPVFGKSYENFRPEIAVPDSCFDPSFNPFESPVPIDNPFDDSIPGPRDAVPQPSSQHYGLPQQDYGKLFEDKTLPSASVLIVQGKYILSQVRSGLLVVNIKRARERILYERFLKAIGKNGHISQSSLFPVNLTIGYENRLLIEDNSVLLTKLGFDISSFGKDEIVVNGLPEGFKSDSQSVETLINDILFVLKDQSVSLAELMESATASKFAMIGACGSSDIKSDIQAQKLIDSLFACENAEYTDKGLKTMTILSLDEIDRKF